MLIIKPKTIKNISVVSPKYGSSKIAIRLYNLFGKNVEDK